MGSNCPQCEGERTIVPVGTTNERYVCLKCNTFFQMYQDKNAIIRIQGQFFGSLKEFHEITRKEKQK